MIVFTLAATPAMAADCSISPIYVDGVAFGDLPGALASVSANSTIEICAGTYTGTFEAPVAVHLVGIDGASQTVLDGDFLGTVLTLPAGSSLTGLTVTHGASLTNGGGVVLSSAGRLDIVETEIVDNHAESFGGGLFVPGGSEVHFSGSRVASNSARDGGGLANETGSVDLALGDSVFEDNEALGEPVSTFSARAGRGGGIFLAEGGISDGLVTDNLAFNDDFFFVPIGVGGGISANGPVRIERTSIVGNVARSGGGLRLTSDTDLEDVVIEGNQGTTGGGGLEIRTLQDEVEITAYGTVIEDNTTNGSGGGISAFASGDRLRWSGGRVIDNFASNSGGGWYSLNGFNEVVDVEFRDNEAGRFGGGLGTNFGSTFFPSSIDIEGCTFSGNSAQLGDGGGADLG
ncbi:MAG: hypothetical protein AAF211_29000, partial [Myxococcota bacterium]